MARDRGWPAACERRPAGRPPGRRPPMRRLPFVPFTFAPFIPLVPMVLGCATAAAQAPGLPVAAPFGDGVAIVRTTVRAAIEDGAATTTIEQAFSNRGARPAEATWLLPLPEGAIADGLKMVVDGKEIAAEVLDQAAARGVYETIVRQRRDPALLEYMGAGLLRARVFPILPQREVTVQVRLRQSLPLHGGLGEWTVPLRALRSGERNEGPIGVDVTVRAGSPLKTVVASRGDAEVRWKGENAARVAF